MKKIFYTLIGLSLTLTAGAQSFSDDFESYSAGAMIAAASDVWETWGSANGGADDAAVVTTNANSGTQSLYFASTSANGGPQDVVLPFPGELAVGQFNFGMWMYINNGSGAYFNFQREDVIGTTWAADIYFDAGVAQFTSGGGLLLQTDYPQATWFQLGMDLNLSTNTWEIYIDGDLRGTYANTQTQIASIDIFPLQNNQFWVDDVSYDYTPYELPALNGAVTNILNMTSGLATQTVTPSVEIRNLGLTAITSFDISVEYNGNVLTESVSGVNIPSLGFYTVDFAETFGLIAGENDAVATISNVNGMSNDDDGLDDEKIIIIDPVVPANGKRVVAEEGTGTWCPWCVRGAVFMELLTERYDEFFIGIAVHNADPMVNTDYDAAIGGLISGYPSGIVDRGPEYDPSQFEIPFLERIQQDPMAFIVNGATWDAGTRTLNVSTSTTFQQTVSGNYRVAVVLTEDGVTGTGADWAQANAYAGGANGVMGGYELLPSPVPASQMVYDHVARALSPSFSGLDNAFTGAMNAGNTTVHNYTFVLPAEWDETRIHIVGMVIAPDGSIDNAASSSIEDAVIEGFVDGTDVVSVVEAAAPDATFQVYPNPAHDQAFVAVNLAVPTDVQMEVFSADGRLVASGTYKSLVGNSVLPIPAAHWAKGMYTIRIVAGDQYLTKSVIFE
ncbi:MAG: hypothetical protein RL226_894 [Bacteroidota bacterium]